MRALLTGLDNFWELIEKQGKAKICSNSQFHLLNAILHPYGTFLPEMSPNNCSFDGF